MLRFCVLGGALVSLASLAWGQEAYIVRRSVDSVLYANGQVVPDFDGAKVDQLAWSKGGKHLAIRMTDGSLKVLYPNTGGLSDVAKAVGKFSWSPSQPVLLFESEGHLWTKDVGQPATYSAKVLAEAKAPSWSPDGTRIAYASKGAIWISLANGTSARRVVLNRSAASIDWSLDGRQLAFFEPGLSKRPGGLFVVGTNRIGLRKVGEANALSVSLSPDSRRLLVEEKPRSRVFDLEKAESTYLAPEGSGWHWISARKLSGLLGPNPVYAELPSGTMEPVSKAEGLPEGLVEKWTERVEVLISNEMLEKGPFAGIAKPTPDSLRIQGFVESVDPLNGKFTISVGTVIDSKGWETNLAQNVTQVLNVPDSARENDGSGRYKPLRVMNIRPDLEVSVIIRASALNGGSVLDVSEVVIAAEKQELGILSKEGPRLLGLALEYDGVSTEKPIVPLVYPVAGKNSLQDWFLASRGGGRRRHHGQDLMAAKMTPMVACFDGIIYLGRGGKKGHYTMSIRGDNGWTANYYHVNNDTPGTDDGAGGDQYAFAPGLESGQRVVAGQFIGYVGDSGNAESTPPHLHFELWDQVTGGVINAYPSLMAANRVGAPTVQAVNPELKPLKGEQRMDGIVRLVDKDRNVVQIDVTAITKNGKRFAATGGKKMWMKLNEKTPMFVRGHEDLKVGFGEIREGLLMTAMVPVKLKGSSASPRLAAFAVAG